MESLGRKIRMSFLNASDGPRIMLFGPMDVDLLALQQCFRELGKCGEQIQLEQQSFVVSFGDVAVIASCSGSLFETEGVRAHGSLVRAAKDARQFEWNHTSEGWDYIAELMNGLLGSTSAAHQYLTAYPKDDAIVVVSKGEYSDNLILESRQ